MALAHTERRHLADVERHLATAETALTRESNCCNACPFLVESGPTSSNLGLCPVVSVPTNEFFFREHDQADAIRR